MTSFTAVPSNVQNVLDKLDGVKPSGPGQWQARCPSHQDDRPSLSIGIGRGGQVLLRCHAGCSFNDVLLAIGIKPTDLFPRYGEGRLDASPTPPASANGCVERKKTGFATIDEAVACFEKRLGRCSRVWFYHDESGRIIGCVARWDTSKGKEIRPFRLDSDGLWRPGQMPSPRPLFDLPRVLKSPVDEVLFVTEGEKCCVEVQMLGLLSTTSVGGAAAPDLTDWGPVCGRVVVVFPDEDQPGHEFAQRVAQLCHAARASQIKIPILPGLEPDSGEDIVDWIADKRTAGLNNDQIRADLLQIVESAPTWSPGEVEKQTSEKPQAGRYVPEIVRLSDVAPTSIPWLWFGRIPLGRITLLVGRPGCGKSFVTLDLAARISKGDHWPDPGFDRAPVGDTLLICAEDDPSDTIRPRLDGAGADCDRIHILKAAKTAAEDGKEKTVTFDLSNVGIVADALDRIPDCKLVIIDPIGHYLGGSVDAHRDNEVRAVLGPLAHIASSRGVAVLLVMHTRKAPGVFADDIALGSRAFVGLARSVLHLMEDPDDDRRKLLLSGKSNLAERMSGLAFRIGGKPARVEWEPGYVEIRADDLVACRDADRRRATPARAAAVEWLTALLKTGPMLVEEIKQEAKAAAISWRTVRRAQEHLGVVAQKRSFSGGWEWRLPEGGHESPKVAK